MGSICDLNDTDRFMRSTEGREYLNTIIKNLEGRTITRVSFENNVSHVLIHLYLDNGEMYTITEPGMDVDVLREDFAEAIEREYYVDYPDRKPSEGRH